MSSDPPRPPLLHLGAFALVGGLVLVLLIEVALRVAGVAPRAEVVVDEASCYFGWAGETWDEVDYRGLEHRLHTDGDGFRVGLSADGVRTEARCRVLAVGDSFTEGMFVRAEETWPAVLERDLASRLGAGSVAVHNGGMRSHGLMQERLGVLGRWRHLEPKVVVLEHTVNDLEDMVRSLQEGCDPDAPVPTGVKRSAPPLIGSTSLYGALRNAGLLLRHVGDRARRMIAPDRPPDCSFAECKLASEVYLRLTLDLARRLGALERNLLVVLIDPFMCRSLDGKQWDAAAYSERFVKALAEAGVELLDLRGILNVKGATFKPKDMHPTAAGYEAIGAAIAKRVAELGWLKACGSSGAELSPSPGGRSGS